MTQTLMVEQARLREAYRQSRLERIRADMADVFDLHDDEDVVCPHCGAYTNSTLTLPPVEIFPKTHRNFEVRCSKCDNAFGCRAEVHFRFTTFKPEPEVTSGE